MKEIKVRWGVDGKVYPAVKVVDMTPEDRKRMGVDGVENYFPDSVVADVAGVGDFDNEYWCWLVEWEFEVLEVV